MSLMQTFRDGYSPKARKRFWVTVWVIWLSASELASLATSAWNYLQGDMQKATFFAVFVIMLHLLKQETVPASRD